MEDLKRICMKEIELDPEKIAKVLAVVMYLSPDTARGMHLLIHSVFALADAIECAGPGLREETLTNVIGLLEHAKGAPDKGLYGGLLLRKSKSYQPTFTVTS